MSNVTQSPQQPGLRSFIVYDELPEGCVAHTLWNGDTEPHIRQGEVAVIDTTDCDPVHGELYLIQWKSGPAYMRQEIVMLQSRLGRYGQRSGEMADCYRWWAGSYAARQPVTLDGRPCGPAARWADGPFDDEHMSERLIGKVVGILVVPN